MPLNAYASVREFSLQRGNDAFDRLHGNCLSPLVRPPQEEVQAPEDVIEVEPREAGFKPVPLIQTLFGIIGGLATEHQLSFDEAPGSGIQEALLLGREGLAGAKENRLEWGDGSDDRACGRDGFVGAFVTAQPAVRHLLAEEPS